MSQPSSFTSHPRVSYAPHSFHGGIHPPARKRPAKQSPLSNVVAEESLVVALHSSRGDVSEPLVSPGQQVIAGQVIATPVSDNACFIHSPVDAEVIKVEPHISCYRNQASVPSIHLMPLAQSKSDVVKDSVNQPAWLVDQTNEAIDIKKAASAIRQAGIVGLGGAAFATHQKLQTPVEKLIINAAECEPYISCDERLMMEFPAELLESFLLTGRLYQASEVIVAIEDDKAEAIERMIDVLDDFPDIQVCLLPPKYPSGGEKQLIELVTGNQLPSGSRPASIGVVTQNVGTCWSIRNALVHGKPLTHRVVTLTGTACTKPGNYWLPLGIRITELLKKFADDNVKRITHGGPMMGYALEDLSAGIHHGTNCIIFDKEDNHSTATACIRCGECADACPASLLPQQLYFYSKANDLDRVESLNIKDCIECGACDYVCPSEIPLVSFYRFAKSELVHRAEEQQSAQHAKSRFEFREQRLARLAKEKQEARLVQSTEAHSDSTSEKIIDKKAMVADAVARARARKQRKQNQ